LATSGAYATWARQISEGDPLASLWLAGSALALGTDELSIGGSSAHSAGPPASPRSMANRQYCPAPRLPYAPPVYLLHGAFAAGWACPAATCGSIRPVECLDEKPARGALPMSCPFRRAINYVRA